MSFSRSRTVGALLICFAASLWGLDGVVLTPRLAPLPVTLVVFLLHAVPFALMQPFLAGRWRVLLRLDRKSWIALLLVALTGGLIGTLAIVHALFLVGFNQLSVVVLLQKLQPVFAIALAGLVLREPIGTRFALWAAVALTGAYLLSFGLTLPQVGEGGVTARAAFWATVAAACFGAATVLGKDLLGSVDVVTATFGRFGVTATAALIVLAFRHHGVPLGLLDLRQWVLVLLISVTTGSGAIFLYYVGLRRVRASIASLCELCLPLTAVLLDRFVNHSVLGPWQWFGAALLIAAIARVTARRPG